MKARYCKCKNKYTITDCDTYSCNAQYYWAHGIGRLTAEPIVIEADIFDNIFDETFN